MVRGSRQSVRLPAVIVGWDSRIMLIFFMSAGRVCGNRSCRMALILPSLAVGLPSHALYGSARYNAPTVVTPFSRTVPAEVAERDFSELR
ncbi:hypothetical protein [Spongiactinospora sp. TRM90649]|uniref:hypothetical protein n=1 Tax=Spongiactinospora sp. TRM90649 TaxID=3031114 RepID=UPI0023F64270|nr:hypothetical protein [Spongiactinospora sp. TRM90649]MDF5758457.1 hypothetical protein [Spongiactinospora sp. TRM90649]